MATDTLKKEITTLEEQLQIAVDAKSKVQEELDQKNKDLEDINKPLISTSQLELIEQAVSDSMEGYFDNLDTDNFELDLSLSYDNQIEIESVNCQGSAFCTEEIMDSIKDMFREQWGDVTIDDNGDCE